MRGGDTASRAEAAVREQADGLAAAWSGPGAPASWALTAALFAADALLALGHPGGEWLEWLR